MKKLLFASFLSLMAVMLWSSLSWCADAPDRLRVALFVQNVAGSNTGDQIEPLGQELGARLTQKGFSIIDRRDVMARFSASPEQDAVTLKNMKALEQLAVTGKTEARLEDGLSGASAVRIAQMLRADYLVMVSIVSLDTEVRTFIGEGTAYGTNNQSRISNLKLSVKVLEGAEGSSLYGDVLSVSGRSTVGERVSIEGAPIISGLLEEASIKISDNISKKVEEIRSVAVAAPNGVSFTVQSNISGATVELDGVVIGSTPGTFNASAGIHNLRVSREWMTNWERTVNIAPGQKINVSLELSEEGMQKYKSLEKFKADIEIEKGLAEGEKKRLENSYERYQGAPATNIIH